jgi:DNA-binding NarL/FixJ family response regulator
MDQAQMAEIAETFLALPPRQRQVVRMFAEGVSQADIGAQLFISTGAVNQHLQRAYRRVGCADGRGQSRQLAKMLGYLEGYQAASKQQNGEAA